MGRRLPGLALTVVAVALLLTWTRPTGAQGAPSTDPPLRLVGQTAWVGPEGTFVATVDAPSLPEGSTISGRLHERVDTGSDLAAALDDDALGDGIFTVSRPVGEAATAAGDLVVSLPVSTTPSGDGQTAWLQFPGVYPFEVVVTGPDDELLGRLVTTLLRLGDSPGPATTPLTLGVVVPVVEPSKPALDGSPYLPDEGVQRVEATLDAVEERPDVPLTLAPSPETMTLLTARDPDLGEVLTTIAQQAGRQVLAGPYADIDAGDFVASGLSAELAEQYDAGAVALQQLLGAVPDGRIAVLDRTDTGDAVRGLLDLDVESLIVPSDQLAPLRGSTADGAFASAFDLLLPADVTAPAVVADEPAAARLAAGGDPTLAAQHALAELAVLQLEQTGDANGVALVVRRDTDPDALAALLAGLADASGAASGSAGAALVRPTTAAELLRDTDPADTTSGGRTTTLVRGYESDEPTPLGGYPVELRRARSDLDGLRSLVAEAPSITEPVEQAVLSSGGRALEPADRSAELAFADRTTTDATDEVVVTPEQVVTLTSSSGLVPLNLENRLPTPVTVRITMSSPKLDFPDGSVIEQVLAPATTTPIQLRVETRATGAFPLDVTITSADGTLPVASTRYTVRSTAISGVGLVLSVGAGAFLLVWWARHFRTARRARKLVGSDHPALSGSDRGGYAPPHTDPREGR